MTQSNITENLGGNSGSLTVGNLGTQVCGAMSMGMIQAQSEIAKTGFNIAKAFTEEQETSYKGQATFLKGGYDAAVTAAQKQADQMRMGAYGEFASAGAGILTFVAPQIHKSYFSETSKQLDVVSDKLKQQEHMLDLAHKGANLTGANVTAQPATAARSANQLMIEARQKELVLTGGGTARTLTANEQKAYPQNPYDRSKGYNQSGNHSYYNENATTEEVSSKTKTLGAYHLKGLDDDAIAGLSDVNGDRTKFIEKLNSEIKSTKTEINTLSNDMQGHRQILDQITQMTKGGSSGTFQMLQAPLTVASKEADAEATLANNSAGIASSVAQNANSAKEGGLSTAQNAMQSFGRVYDGMRG